MEGFYVYLSSDSSEKTHSKNTHAAFTVQLANTIELDPNCAWSVAIAETIFPSTDQPTALRTYSGIMMTDFTKGPIFIYSDLVRTSNVGDSDSKLLRIISPPKAHQTFIDRHYIPVVGRRISQISILMTDRLGVRYPLSGGKVPVILVLHFEGRPWKV